MQHFYRLMSIWMTTFILNLREVHFGGCGGIFTTASGSGTRAALGLPFKLQ